MDAAARGWMVALVGLGAYDLWLVRTGRCSLTQCARHNRWMTAAGFGLLGLHFLDRLGPLDPFHAVGRYLTPYRPE